VDPELVDRDWPPVLWLEARVMLSRSVRAPRLGRGSRRGDHADLARGWQCALGDLLELGLAMMLGLFVAATFLESVCWSF